MMTRAFICGCAALVLSDDEKRFIAETRPWGLILFKRNVGSTAQLAELAQSFRDLVGRADAPVLIDQEGGRVQRLAPPNWPAYPAAAVYAGLSSRAADAAGLAGRLIASDLREAGITIDCAPVLDVPQPGSHRVIGDRAFADDPEVVARTARAFADGLLQGGVLPVVKHVPGHGRAGVDSHLDLPVVTASRLDLEQVDFVPFQRLADLPIAMTAHVVFTALDPERPATTSRTIVETVIRGAIGFDGLLLTDDLSMEALKGSLAERAIAARDAGCDILLHCNGKLDEARAVAAEAIPLDHASARRAERALAMTAGWSEADTSALRSRFAALFDGAAA